MRLHNSGTWRNSAYVPYRKWRTRNHGSRAPRPTHIPMTVIWILRIQCITPNHGYQSMIMTLSRQSLQSVRLKLLFFVFDYYNRPICCNFSVCVYCFIFLQSGHLNRYMTITLQQKQNHCSMGKFKSLIKNHKSIFNTSEGASEIQYNYYTN